MDILVPIVTLVVGAVLGAVLGAWYSIYLRRPKLGITGGGGGGGPGPGHHRNHVTVSNRPGLPGIRLNETAILGWRIHGPIEKGYAVDRDAAKECRATILDKQTGRHIAPLWWRSRSSEYSNTVTIESGQSYDLMLFARLDSEPLKYFVFASKPETPHELMIPVEEAKFADTHEFAVKITYAYGRQQLRFDITMRKGFDGRLYYEGKHGGGSF
jgi:hypothetical protein